MKEIDKKLERIIQDLELIKKSLKIVPDRDTKISDFDSSIQSYEAFAIQELKLAQITINNHKSAIHGFLNHSKGIINKQTVKEYLNSNESSAWKSNQTKALRKYLRDFLHLGRWIEEFQFSKSKAKIKEMPTDEELVQFFNILSNQAQIAFLLMFNSGLRIGEVLSLRETNIDFEINMIDATDIHKGDTKSSWISFFTKQTAEILNNYMQSDEFLSVENDKIFSISVRAIQQAFEFASDKLGISLNPHLLRTVFTEKCSKAGLNRKYIDAFCGRIPQSILAKHYTDYSPKKLREEYDKIESYLML